MIKGYLYRHTEGDRKIVEEYLEQYSEQTNQELISTYNKAFAKSFFGSSRQALSIIALNITFNKRFGKSPISISDNRLVEFTELIHPKGDSWVFWNSEETSKKIRLDPFEARAYWVRSSEGLSDLSDEELLLRINATVGFEVSGGIARQGYLWSIRDQLNKRRIDYENLMTANGISLKHAVLLKDNKL